MDRKLLGLGDPGGNEGLESIQGLSALPMYLISTTVSLSAPCNLTPPGPEGTLQRLALSNPGRGAPPYRAAPTRWVWQEEGETCQTEPDQGSHMGSLNSVLNTSNNKEDFSMCAFWIGLKLYLLGHCCRTRLPPGQVESCWLLTRDGVTVHLQPQSEEIPGAYPTVHTTFSRQIQTRSTGRHKLGGQEVSVQVRRMSEAGRRVYWCLKRWRAGKEHACS